MLRGRELTDVFSVSCYSSFQGKENIKELDTAMEGWKWEAGMTVFNPRGCVSFCCAAGSANSPFAV